MTALVERGQATARLEALVDRTVSSHGGLGLVTGEAGIGKTTLVAAAVDRARSAGALTAVGTCWDREGAPDHWPWVQVVRTLAAIADPGVWAEARRAAGGEVEALLGRGSGPVGGGSAAARFALHDATTTLLTSLARHRPVVVVLEDLHWADGPSLDLLSFASRHGWFEPLLLLGTYRDVEVEAGGHPHAGVLADLAGRATTVVVTGLDPDGVGRVVAAVTGSEPPAAVVEALHRRTGGNPFFVEQAARLWHTTGDVDAVPPGVREAVARRLATLPAGVRDALRTTALLGRRSPRQVVEAALAVGSDQASAGGPGRHGGQEARQGPDGGPPDDGSIGGDSSVDAVLGPAVRARLVTLDHGGVSFVHDLVREALVDGLGPSDAATRHARLLDRLSEPDLSGLVGPADLAHHAEAAGALIDVDRRVALALAAAREALGRMAPDEAVRHLRRALSALPDDRRRDEVFLRVELGWTLIRSGDLPATRAEFTEACRIALDLDDGSLLTRAALSLRAAVWMVSTDEEERQAQEMVDEAHRRIVIGRGLESTATDALGRERELTAEALDMCRGSGDLRAHWDALTVRHDAVWAPGTERERLALDDEMVAVAERSGSATAALDVRQRRMLDLVEAGDPRAIDEHDDLLARATRIDTAYARSFARWSRTIVAGLTGRFDEARKLLDELASIDRPSGAVDHADLDGLSVQLRWSIELAQGRAEGLDAVLAIAAAAHPAARLLRAATAAEQGEGARAASLLDPTAAGRAHDRWFAPLALRARAQTAALTRDPEALAEVAEELGRLGGRWAVMPQAEVHGPYDLWAGVVAHARGRARDAEQLLRSAVAAAEVLGARPWVVEARARLAEVVGDDPSRVEEAAGLVDVVGEEARRLGMAFTVARVERVAERVARSVGGVPAEASVATGTSGAIGGGARASGTEAAPPDTADDQRSVWDASEVVTGVFRRAGDVWEVGLGGTTVHVPDAKGLHDIHALLGRPGMGVRAVDLLDHAAGREGRAAAAMGGDEVLDERAKAAYRARLEALDGEIEGALARGDDGRAASLDTERAALIDELRRATGLGGRSRRLGDDAERARKAVRERVRDSIRRLGRVHPGLAEHLDASIRTGATCAYEPAHPVEWHR